MTNVGLVYIVRTMSYTVVRSSDEYCWLMWHSWKPTTAVYHTRIQAFVRNVPRRKMIFFFSVIFAAKFYCSRFMPQDDGPGCEIGTPTLSDQNQNGVIIMQQIRNVQNTSVLDTTYALYNLLIVWRECTRL